MRLRVWLIIGITGLNICFLQGQEQAWEQHLLNGRKLRARALYKEAEKEYAAAVEAAKAFGPEDLRLARARNNLAALYQDQGRYPEAETLYRQAAAAWERGPESESLDLSVCLNNLAAVEHLLGRNKEAESLYLRSMAIREKSQAPDDPDVAAGWNNLGELYLSMGRHREAEELLRRALAAREKALGPDDPGLARILGTLGLLCR